VWPLNALPMQYAINLTASDETGVRLRSYWADFDRFDPETAMASLGHPPHVTLAVYDEIAGIDIQAVLASVFDGVPAVRLRFSALKCFEEPAFVVWAAPDPSEALARLHAAVHAAIDPGRCHEHYRPRIWVPHATLAIGIPQARRSEARALATQVIAPFEVVFDTADCSAFYPVRTIARRPLRLAP